MSRRLVALACLAAGIGFAPGASAGSIDNHWNQWDDDRLDGVVQGTTALGLGIDYARVGGSDHTIRLAAEAEHLLRDRWGLVGSVALPLDGTWVAPAKLGLRFHFVPKFPVDPFVGVDGGVAWLRPSGLADVAAPIVDVRGGVAIRYFGLFFAQVDGGYDFVRYDHAGVALDRGGASFGGRLGVNF